MTKAIRKCFPESCCVLCNIHIEENYEKIPPPMDLEGLKYHTMTMEEHVPEFAKYCKTKLFPRSRQTISASPCTLF